MSKHRRVRAVLCAGAVALAAAACQGTPDAAFNGGEAVDLPAFSMTTQGVVLRLADGGTAVSVNDPTAGPMVVRLAPDGSVDTTWGDEGRVAVPFRSSTSVTGADDGVALADGSLVLQGGLNRYHYGTIRITPDGAIDQTYGDAGALVTNDAFNGVPDHGRCELLADGSQTCVQPTADALVVQRFDATGADAGSTTVAAGLAGRFAATPPPGSQYFRFSAYPFAVAVRGGDIVAVIRVSSHWYDGEGMSHSTESHLVVLRIRGAAVDPDFGDAGYRLLDLETAGPGALALGAGEDGAAAGGVAIGSDGSVTAAVSAEGWAGPEWERVHGVVRLTSAGDLDAAAAGGGLWAATLADGTPVETDAVRTRPDGSTTVGGHVGDGSTSAGVILRYRPDGLLDERFSGDGVVEVAGSREVHSVDDRSGRTTYAALGATIDGEGNTTLATGVLMG